MRALVFVLTALILGACAQTQVASFVDPAYRGGAAIRSMVVVAETPRLGEREALESAAVAELAARGVRAQRMIDLAPPTRPGGPAAEAAAIRAAGVRAVLRIAVDQRATVARYIPPTYVGDPFFPYYGYGYGYYPGPFAGLTTDGRWVEEPTARYEATLQEAGGGTAIWKGEAVARGGSNSNFADLAARAARDLVSRLQQDKVI
ncbi:hypothetical protein FFK22_010245 [Mycobacterium sp. KBS0706]|uniref:hypothetical protein n=1 Tax=Mycobacterium sp. KBS0706 TaxID=2578109 RepID=UPI00110FB321|nr:hypothetical protein [Mycobacterium sp. KBS0706]TSD88863.1 hypothetical protein FFK22_010245 [Mycobacterium sp. KBS0706]